MLKDNHSDEQIKKFYELKNIAVVGMSRNSEKPSNFVPKYLLSQGYNIIPVNPTSSEIMGMKSYQKASEIPTEIDIVDVFRKSEEVYSVIEDCIIKNGIKVIWLQEGIHNPEAEKLASRNNIDVVFNRCMMEEHRRLFID